MSFIQRLESYNHRFIIFAVLLIALLALFAPMAVISTSATWQLYILLHWVPLILVIAYFSRPASYRLLAYALVAWLVTDAAVLMLSSADFISTLGKELQLQWNWSGKAGGLIVCLFTVALITELSWHEIGFVKPNRVGMYIVLSVVLLMLIVDILLPSVAELWINVAGAAPVRTETLLYQLLIPTLVEEIQYRGIIQTLLNQCWRQSMTIWGVRIGWSTLITAALFALVHGISMDNNDVSVDYLTIVIMLPEALFLSWLRERSASLFPGMIYHSATNTIDLIYKTLLFGLK